MLITALRIDERAWAAWLAAAGNRPGLRRVEMAATVLLEQPRAVTALLERNGLQLLQVSGALSGAEVDHLAAAGDAAVDRVLPRLEALAGLAARLGARSLELDPALDRIPETGGEDALRGRVRLLQRLLPLALQHGLEWTVPCRLPAALPAQRDWHLAANLVYETMHPACRLAVQLHVGELGPAWDPLPALRACLFQTQLFRLVYEPACGETADPGWLPVLLDELRRHSFSGGVVFAPLLSRPEERLEAVLNGVKFE